MFVGLKHPVGSVACNNFAECGAYRRELDCILARYNQQKPDLTGGDMHEIKQAVWNALEQLKRRGCEAFMEGIFVPLEFKEEWDDVFKEKFIFLPCEHMPGGKPGWEMK